MLVHFQDYIFLSQQRCHICLKRTKVIHRSVLHILEYLNNNCYTRLYMYCLFLKPDKWSVKNKIKLFKKHLFMRGEKLLFAYAKTNAQINCAVTIPLLPNLLTLFYGCTARVVSDLARLLTHEYEPRHEKTLSSGLTAMPDTTRAVQP